MQQNDEVGTIYFCSVCGEPVLKIIGITDAEISRIKQLKPFRLVCKDCIPAFKQFF